MANNVNETRKRAFEALCDYHRYREVGLSERQIADLFGIRSIPTFRLFKLLLRYYVAHRREEEVNHGA